MVDIAFEAVKPKATTTVKTVKEAYKPQRRYKRHDADKLRDEETRVHSTLLEYGRRYGVSRTEKEEKEEEKARKKAAAAGLTGKDGEEVDLQAEEEGKLTPTAVGSIVGMQSQEIQQIASEYAERQAEIEQIEKSERVGGAQQHKRITTALNRQIEQAQTKLAEVQAKHDELHKTYLDTQEKLKEDEMARLKENIEQLQRESGEIDSEDKARKNREIAGLQRKIDEVPSRAELSQYQRRFVELYHQVSSTHRETKQFYTLYNTLDDTKLYLNKEVNLLNSIHDNFKQAMSSPANKEQFLKQFEQIVEGIKQNREKVEKKRQEEKMRRDQLSDQYLDLIEKQRLYFKTVKDFKEECRKNEILLSKLRSG
nr:hypothetical protein BaRGS_016708 [Batillaria attramentaria]